MSKKRGDFSTNMQNVIDECTALHFPTHEGHIPTLLTMLANDVLSIKRSLPEDAILAAYKIEEHVDRIAGYVLKIHHAAEQIINATPDEIMTGG